MFSFQFMHLRILIGGFSLLFNRFCVKICNDFGTRIGCNVSVTGF